MLRQFLHHHKRYRLPALLTLLFLLLVFLFSEEISRAFYAFVYWTERLMIERPLLGALFFFFASGLSALLAFASSLILLPSAVLTWGTPTALFLLWSGWLFGGMVAYALGVFVARPALASLVKPEKLNHYTQFVSREASFWIILLFCLAVPSEIPGYVLGILRYPFPRFIVAIGTAEILYALGAVLVAKNLLHKDVLATFGTVLLVILLAVLTSFLLNWVHRKRKSSLAARVE